jgi:DNA-binding transcriptional ArsR family regulator
MADNSRIAAVAALIGDAGRASMLTMMMDGRAHTAGELATAAGVSAATASGHLGKLLERDLVVVAASGRHRYYRLASTQIASMLESIMLVAESPRSGQSAISRVPDELREARTCYDHIAGRLGVAIAARLTVDPGMGSWSGECEISAPGRRLLVDLGIDIDELHRRRRRMLCRNCLDWSERRPHIAGVLGTELLERLLSLGWIRRTGRSRELRVTGVGRNKLLSHFGYRPPSISA